MNVILSKTRTYIDALKSVLSGRLWFCGLQKKEKNLYWTKTGKKLTALKEKNDGCGIIPAEGKGSSVGPWHPGKKEVGDTVIK